MEYNIIDKIKSSEELQAQLKNGIEERKETYREQLERLYNYDILPGYNLTKEDAIKISMQNRKAIDSFYFNNITRFSRMAYAFVRRNNYGTAIYTVEDILNQIYIVVFYHLIHNLLIHSKYHFVILSFLLLLFLIHINSLFLH